MALLINIEETLKNQAAAFFLLIYPKAIHINLAHPLFHLAFGIFERFKLLLLYFHQCYEHLALSAESA